MLIPQLSEAAIRHNANTNSFSRGEAYQRSGSVGTVTLRGNTLQAEVEGSEVDPYLVTLTIDAGGITSALCTCPYDYDGWCKHIVATALTCIRQSAALEERPTLERLLDRLNPVQTQHLVQRLVAEQPELIGLIDRLVELLEPPASRSPSGKLHPGKQPRRTHIDPVPIRRQTKQILRESLRAAEEGYEEISVAEDLQVLIDKAQEFAERQDGNSAIIILEAITDTCRQEWDELEDYGLDFDETGTVLNEAWTQAILSADLTSEEKVDLQVTLENFQDELGDYFEMSLEALRQGWDYPPLQDVLRGDRATLWPNQPPSYADDLAQVRLHILEQQERDEEYLSLAKAEGQTQLYLTKLSQVGAVEQAIAAAQTTMTTAEQAFALAKSLREQGAIAESLQIALQGLGLEGSSLHNLATWTGELAEGLGDRAAAQTAYTIAFKTGPSFADYRRLEALAGETWPSLKAELLLALQSYTTWGAEPAKIDIYLHEELLDEAIATVSSSGQIHRVMNAALTYRPDWVIETARHRAEDIMNRGKAEAYAEAAQWLGKVRAAYLATEQRENWVKYHSDLMRVHARKHKMMGFLKGSDLS